MPLYEYICEACEHAFEVLVRNADDAEVRCSACGSSGARKRFSAFAMSVNNSSSRGRGLRGTLRLPNVRRRYRRGVSAGKLMFWEAERTVL